MMNEFLGVDRDQASLDFIFGSLALGGGGDRSLGDATSPRGDLGESLQFDLAVAADCGGGRGATVLVDDAAIKADDTLVGLEQGGGGINAGIGNLGGVPMGLNIWKGVTLNAIIVF